VPELADVAELTAELVFQVGPSDGIGSAESLRADRPIGEEDVYVGRERRTQLLEDVQVDGNGAAADLIEEGGRELNEGLLPGGFEVVGDLEASACRAARRGEGS
jgi:hypothetical protein